MFTIEKKFAYVHRPTHVGLRLHFHQVGKHLQILMRPAEHKMQLNYISSIVSYTKRNGTEISVNQALG